jgi:glycolate oxidase FAD binding subunit
LRPVLLRSALTGPMEHQEDDLTVVSPAGNTLAEIGAVLAGRGQRLPVDPPLPGSSTLGGVLASGLSGPLRSRFGQPKDLVLGMTALRADGELVRAGGRVVKNVTGYDLMRLWCGSLGTLGIITEAAMRVYPIAPLTWLGAQVPDLAAGAALIDRLYRADIRPEVADVVADAAGVRVIAGVPTPAAAEARVLLSARETTDADYVLSRDAGYLGTQESLLINVAAARSGIEQVIKELSSLRPGVLVVRPLVPVVRAAWGDGALPGRDDVAAFVARARASLTEGNRGFVTVERMPAAWRALLSTWGEPTGTLEIMRRLKATFDPDGRFARGRFAGGI